MSKGHRILIILISLLCIIHQKQIIMKKKLTKKEMKSCKGGPSGGSFTVEIEGITWGHF